MKLIRDLNLYNSEGRLNRFRRPFFITAQISCFSAFYRSG
nr:MAG TPA: hypothetical protein [Caudoviricetes sp.]